MAVLHVQTEQRGLTAVQMRGSGLPPQTMRHKTDHYYNKEFSSPYLQIDSTFPWTKLEGQLSLGTDMRSPPALWR